MIDNKFKTKILKVLQSWIKFQVNLHCSVGQNDTSVWLNVYITDFYVLFIRLQDYHDSVFININEHLTYHNMIIKITKSM